MVDRFGECARTRKFGDAVEECRTDRRAVERVQDLLDHLILDWRPPAESELSRREWKLRIPLHELEESESDATARLADDLDTADRRILNELVSREFLGVHPGQVVCDPIGRSHNVREVVGKPRLAHTGTAVETTASRKLSGSAPGVTTSTSTPKSWMSSWRMAPISRSVVSDVESISRSKSLAAESRPRAAEPNTRGFVARCARTTRRTSSRCAARADDGVTASRPSRSSIRSSSHPGLNIAT